MRPERLYIRIESKSRFTGERRYSGLGDEFPIQFEIIPGVRVTFIGRDKCAGVVGLFSHGDIFEVYQRIHAL